MAARYPYFFYAPLTEALVVMEVREDRVTCTVTSQYTQTTFALSKEDVTDGCLSIRIDEFNNRICIETEEGDVDYVSMGDNHYGTVLYLLLYAFMGIEPNVNFLSFANHIDPRCRRFLIEKGEAYIDLVPVSWDDIPLLDLDPLTIYRPMSMG